MDKSLLFWSLLFVSFWVLCHLKTAKMRRISIKKLPLRNDAIIVGGGPSGLVLASCLGAAGFSVMCIDRKLAKAPGKKPSDGRTTALSYGSVKILEYCGVWPLLRETACPILDIRVADRDSPFFLEFDHKEIGQDPFGWIIENGIFHDTLRHHVRRLKTVHFIDGEMEKMETDENEGRIHLKDGRVFAASLIVGADG